MATWNAGVTQSSGDGNQGENNPPGTMYITATTGYTAFNNQWNGFIFEDCPIPKGSVINSVTHTIYAHFAASQDIKVTIDVELGDAALLTTTGGDLSSRTLTGSPVTWTTTVSGIGDKTTADITARVQAVVDDAGWAAGNNLGVIHRGQGVAHEFYYRMWDNSSNGTGVATISIDYTPPAEFGVQLSYGSPGIRIYP